MEDIGKFGPRSGMSSPDKKVETPALEINNDHFTTFNIPSCHHPM
jgi:hypothetical protein